MTQHQINGVVVGFTIGFLLLIAIYVLWASHDRRLDDLEAKVAATPVSDATEPMPRVQLAGGKRTTERPTPHPRAQLQRGRHAK